MPNQPPESIEVLLHRAHRLAGRTLSWLAAEHGQLAPPDLRRAKGWIGQLLETELGATGGSKAQHDLSGLSVEPQNLPVNPQGRVRETTYVCTAPLDGSMASRWEDCWVQHKLSKVLWIPIMPEVHHSAGTTNHRNAHALVTHHR